MKTSLQLVAVAAVTSLMLVAVSACGKKDDAKAGEAGQATTTSASTSTSAKASCDMLAELGTCNEYSSGTSFGLEKSLCEGFHGKFASAGCSTDGQIGSCVMSDGEVKRYYGSRVAGDHALTVEEAKGDCESDAVKGKFTVDPAAASAAGLAEAPTQPAAKAVKPHASAPAKAAPSKK